MNYDTVCSSIPWLQNTLLVDSYHFNCYDIDLQMKDEIDNLNIQYLSATNDLHRFY